MVGFFTGTLLLVGPVRFVTAEVRARGWTDEQENWLMMGVIGVYVIASAALAWWLFRRVCACRTRRSRVAIPVTLTVTAVCCLWAWMNPTVLARVAGGVEGEVRTGVAEFVFGSYPDRDRLIELKREGYTAVISLQHPAVLPFEPHGIADEQRHAQEIGITFIHAPMVPWVSENEGSLEKIRAIARTRRGKFYVHCGLGRDRANVVKSMLEADGARVAIGEGFAEASSFAERRAEGGRPLERGEFREIEKDVWLIPYPNKHELFGNMLAGQVKHVMLLLDQNNPVERPWLAEARQLFTEFRVAYSVDPLPPGDLHRARELREKLRHLPRPLVIVVPFTKPHGPTDVVNTFLQAYTAAPLL